MSQTSTLPDTVYVSRLDGAIRAVLPSPVENFAVEPVPLSDPDVQQFLAPPALAAPVTSAQALMALYNAGHLDALKAIIAAHPYRPVRIWFEKANHWERSNPYIQILGPELGLSEADIDDLFANAAQLSG